MKKVITTVMLLSLCLAAFAQREEYGHLMGTVYDDAGNPLPGVKVIVGSREVTTLDDGSFMVRYLPAGRYPIILEKDGKTHKEEGIVNAGEVGRVTFTLPTAEKRTLRTADNELAVQVTGREIHTFATDSPDGQLLAARVQSEETNWFDIWVLDRQGRKLFALAEQPEQETYPQWSPAGDSVLYSTYSGRTGWEIWEQPFPMHRGARVKRGRGNTATWFRDEKSIIFVKYDKDYNAHLYTLDLGREGVEPERLPEDTESTPGQDLYPCYGRVNGEGVIVFSSSKGTGRQKFSEIWIMNADGSNRQQLTRLGRNAYGPVLSKDGERIAFWVRGDQERPDAVWLMNSDGSDLREWMEAAKNPQWGAYPKTLYFSSWLVGYSQIWKAVIGVRSQEELIERLRNVGDLVGRCEAAEALGEIGDAKALASLVDVLADRGIEPDIRWRAAEALGKLGDHAAIKALIGALGDHSSEVRKKAAEALGRLGNPEATGALMGVLKDRDEDPEVRAAAVAALGALSALAMADPGFVADLAQMARQNTEHDLVRQEAVYTLGKIGGSQAFQALQSIASADGMGDPAAEEASMALRSFSLQVKVQSGSIAKTDCEIAILPLFLHESPVSGAAGIVDKVLNGSISKSLKEGVFKGDAGSTHHLLTEKGMPAKYVLLVGLGERKAFNNAVAEKAGIRAMEAVLGLGKFSRIATVVPGGEATGISLGDTIRAFIGGFSVAFKTGNPHRQMELQIVESDPAKLQIIKEATGSRKY